MNTTAPASTDTLSAETFPRAGHCPACCPVARIEGAAHHAGYELGRTVTTPRPRPRPVATFLLYLLLVLAVLVQLRALAEIPTPAAAS